MRVHIWLSLLFITFAPSFHSLTIQLLFSSPVAARVPSAASQTRGAIAAVIAAIASSWKRSIVVASLRCVALLRALTVALLRAPGIGLTVESSLSVVLSIKTALLPCLSDAIASARLYLGLMVVPAWLYLGLMIAHARLYLGLIIASTLLAST